MTPVQVLNRPCRPYVAAIRDAIASKEAALAVTTATYHRAALWDEIIRLRRILAEEEAR